MVAGVGRFAIQFISNVDDYTGKLYIDEINISPTPASDGGAVDGSGDRPDVREGGTGDGRDAPAGG